MSLRIINKQSSEVSHSHRIKWYPSWSFSQVIYQQLVILTYRHTKVSKIIISIEETNGITPLLLHGVDIFKRNYEEYKSGESGKYT